MNLVEKMHSRREALEKQVYVEDGHIVINVSYEYNTALNRYDSAEKLLHWIWYLTEKNWMTNGVMRRFIEVACKENNIDMIDA